VVKLPKLTAVDEPGEDGWYVASCPELGIVSQGETPEHAEEMIKEAVELWLECADESEVRRRLNERKVAIKELEVTHDVCADVEKLAGGKSLSQLAKNLLEAVDPDKIQSLGGPSSSEAEEFIKSATAPIAQTRSCGKRSSKSTASRSKPSTRFPKID